MIGHECLKIGIGSLKIAFGGPKSGFGNLQIDTDASFPPSAGL